jgi:hypothetical protein
MEEKDNFNGKIRDLKSPIQFQERNLENVSLKHLNHRISGLSFLPFCQRPFMIETSSAAKKRLHVSFGHWSFSKGLGNTVEVIGNAGIDG